MQFDHARWRPKRARAVIAAAAITVTWLAVAPVPASASSLDGCSGTATSLDANGEVIDAATASGGAISDTQDGRPGATASNPFVIDADGIVNYQGKTDTLITDHHWSVTLFGLKVAQGGSANEQGLQETSGQYDLGAKLPLHFTGLVRVRGNVTGTGGSCAGDGYVQLAGNPLGSPLMWAGMVLGVLGLFGMFLALPRIRPMQGVGGGEGA